MQSIKKKVAVSAMAMAVAGGLTAVTAPTADAATAWHGCTKGYLCVYTGTNGTGAVARYKHGDSNLADAYGPRGMNNDIASVWNRTGTYFGLFNNKYCGGGITLVYPRAKGNINPKKYRNVASSIDDIRADGCG